MRSTGSSASVFRVFAYAAGAAALVWMTRELFAELPSIRRYLRLSRM